MANYSTNPDINIDNIIEGANSIYAGSYIIVAANHLSSKSINSGALASWSEDLPEIPEGYEPLGIVGYTYADHIVGCMARVKDGQAILRLKNTHSSSVTLSPTIQVLCVRS